MDRLINASVDMRGMNVARDRAYPKFFSLVILAAAIFVVSQARAAELVMFERAGCEWCAVFNREIAPIYGKTDEGKRAPLRRVNVDSTLPADLSAIEAERLAPVFVLVDQGREVGRIRGYPGEDHFWGLLGALLARLDRTPANQPGL